MYESSADSGKFATYKSRFPCQVNRNFLIEQALLILRQSRRDAILMECEDFRDDNAVIHVLCQ
jgi:hypothetical protein